MAKNPEAKITVKMFTDDFKKGAAELKNESSTISREFKLQSEQMKLTATETEKLEAKIGFLTQKQDIAARSVEQSQQAYNEAVRLFGENSKAAQDMAKNLDNARIDEQKLKNEIELANRSLQSQLTEANQTADGVDNLGDSLVETSQDAKKMGDSMSDVGTKMSVGVTAPILAAGGAMLAIAKQFESATADIQSSLGITKDEAEELKNVAQNVWEDGFGESIDEVSNALIRVKQNMKEVKDNAELEKVTRDAMLLAKTFDSDVNEVTRAGNNLMTNFGISSGKAFDLMAKGAQNGLNFSNELFDNLAEYAPLWADMGYSAEEMFGILERGAKNGVYNLDYVNDVMKEFQIRIQDGSKSTSDAMAGMLKETQEMFDAFQAGEVTVAEMSQQVAKDLATLDNRVDKNALGVALFGTKWEDLGGDVVLSMLKSNESMKDFEGAMKGISEVQEQTFGQRFKSMLRQAQSALLPLGNVLLDLAEDWLPKLSSSLESATEWFESLSPEMLETILVVGGLAAAIGPLLVVAGTLVNSLGAIKLGLTAVSGPIGLTIAGIAGLAAVVGVSIDAYKEANDINIEALEVKQAEIKSNDELIKSYDDLQSKNRLTTDEMLRYLDIQAELEATNAPEAVKALKDEQGKLLEKSTLTNDQMDEFLGLNQKVIDNAPSTVKAISEQGTAYATNTSALKELNAEKAKELEQAAYETLTKALEKEKGLLQEQKQLLTEINEKNLEQQASKEVVRSLAQEIIGHENTILELERQKNGASAQEIIQLDGKITREQDVLNQKNEQKKRAEEMIVTYGKQIGKREEMLGKNRQELAQLEAAQFKYEEIILAQAGINAEKGQGINKINEEIKKLETAKSKLSEQLAAGKLNTTQFQEQNTKIDTQISKLKTAKDELKLINDVAGKTVYKDINLQEKPKNFWDTLDAKLGKKVTKTIDFSYKYPKMGGPVGEVINNSRSSSRSVLNSTPDSWYRTGGVFTKPVVAGNAGFGDVTEAIVPFEGSHAARIAGLIAEQQSKLASVADTIAPPQPIYIQVVSELDGQAVANNQYKYLNGMTTSDYNIGKVVRGY